MENKTEMKIINSDLLQFVDLDEWEVVNENQIRSKIEEKNIELKKLSKDYNEKIEKIDDLENSVETIQKSNYKKSINLTIEIPEQKTENIKYKNQVPLKKIIKTD